MNSSTSNSESNSESSSERAGRQASEASRYLAWYVVTTALLALFVVAVNYAVDPLQIYRAARYPALYIENQRYQNAGLARQLARGTVIVGTSHAENFRPSHVERILGGPALKLAIEGGTAHEQRRVLELALAGGETRRVLWVLDFIAFRKPVDAVGQGEGDFPDYLYDEGAFLERLRRYAFSLDTLALSARALLGLGEHDLDGLNAWHADHAYGAREVFADYGRRAALIDAVKRDPSRGFGIDLVRVRESLEVNLFSLVADHPDVRFDLVFPPYSMAAYLADLRISPRTFDQRQAYKAMVVEAAASYPNVRVFDFQGEARISEDLANYKDLEHYRIEVNDWMLESIRDGRYRVSAGDYEAQLARDREALMRYRDRVCAAGPPMRRLCPR